jgi:hypothetical protein
MFVPQMFVLMALLFAECGRGAIGKLGGVCQSLFRGLHVPPMGLWIE